MKSYIKFIEDFTIKNNINEIERRLLQHHYIVCGIYLSHYSTSGTICLFTRDGITYKDPYLRIDIHQYFRFFIWPLDYIDFKKIRDECLKDEVCGMKCLKRFLKIIGNYGDRYDLK